MATMLVDGWHDPSFGGCPGARVALVDAGLPRPQTQVEIFDECGGFVARVDMAYEDVLVAIEYDGAQHWTDPAVRQRDIDK